MKPSPTADMARYSTLNNKLLLETPSLRFHSPRMLLPCLIILHALNGFSLSGFEGLEEVGDRGVSL